MTKITPEHLARAAFVYVRQSTADQVLNNHESRRRQYALVDRARALGWAAVEVIDDDLGRSGSGIARPGFEKLLAAICEGRVGAVVSIEASRLARNGRDWHTLLEFCGLVGTLIADEEASTSPHLDTPLRLTSARPEQITVTDPTHPLFGRCFALSSVTGAAAGGHALVVYRGDVLLKVPIGATSLSPAPPPGAPPPPVSSKLSLRAIRDLIRLASHVTQTRRSASGEDPGAERPEGDTEPGSATSRRSPGGEP